MGIFELNKNERLDTFVKNIKSKNITISRNLYNSKLDIEIHGVKFGEVNGHEIMLDETIVNSFVNSIVNACKKNSTKYFDYPKKIIVYENMPKEKENTEKETLKDNSSKMFDIIEPKWDLEDVYISDIAKNNILTALNMIKYKDKLFNEWKLKGGKNGNRASILNFWGKPGTGKTMTAEAVAKYLNKKLLVVNYSELESKYVGDTPKNIKKVFDEAIKNNAVIVFDEADSFLGKRLTNVTQSADYGVNIARSVLLIELENYNGIVIFTTNLIKNYDEAFKRRILASIQFDLPDETGRKQIWKVHIPKELPLSDDVNIDVLAKSFDNISGADIKDIIIMAATETLRKNKEKVDFDDFKYAYNIIVNRYKGDNSKFENVNISTETISKEQYEKEINNER